MSDWPALGGGGAVDLIGSVSSSLYQTLTAPGTAHTKSAYTQLVAATAQQYDGLHLVMTGPTQTARIAVDIAIGAGGSEQIVLPDFPFASLPVSQWIPLALPAGVRVAARIQSSQVSAVARLGLQAYGRHHRWPPGYTNFTHHGYDSSRTGGPSIDAGGTANTKSAYVQIVASTAAAIKLLWLVCWIDTTSTLTAGNNVFDLAIGAGGSEQVLLPNVCVRMENIAAEPNVIGPFPVDIAAGTRLAARMQSSTTAANPSGRFAEVTVYGAC